jgi:diguanylate cyclase (GGDEF)-like protein
VVLSAPGEASKVCDTALVNEEIDLHVGDERTITQVGYPVNGPSREPLGHIWIFEDVTRERQTAKQLIYLAERDSLTGLYNRRRFQQELSRALFGTARRGTSGALLLFDLDEFKYINDNFGHQAGDTVLVRVAGEVGGLIRHTEQFARLGGDEFGLLMPEATPAEVQSLAERVIKCVAQIPFRIDGRAIQLTTSVGVAMYPEHGTEHDELIARADAAMYQAKAAGKNGWRIYRPDRDASRDMVERLSWNRRLEEALKAGDFRLHFQGVYDTHSGRLTHIEALLRMLDVSANNELIAPGRFIAFAEKTGRILDIDRWVIRRAVETLTDANYPRGVPLSVNVSGRSLDDPSLPEFIMQQLRSRNVPASQFMVEVTETAAISDLADAQRFVDQLRQFGCKVCLDDFGAGFCSFTYIKHLAVDIIKIDGQFIVNLPHGRDNQVFVKAMVDVARGVGKQTVAEFVQDAATHALLKEMGVDMLQGYYLSVPAAEFPRRFV